MSARPLVLLLAALLLTAVAAVGHRLASPPATGDATPDAGCDLQQGACGATLPGGGRMTLSILPRPIPLLKPLSLEVTTTGIKVARVEVDFTGVDMNMGNHRVSLATVAPGRFNGEATLPICVTGRMQWQASVTLRTTQGDLLVPFRFFAPS